MVTFNHCLIIVFTINSNNDIIQSIKSSRPQDRLNSVFRIEIPPLALCQVLGVVFLCRINASGVFVLLCIILYITYEAPYIQPCYSNYLQKEEYLLQRTIHLLIQSDNPSLQNKEQVPLPPQWYSSLFHEEEQYLHL